MALTQTKPLGELAEKYAAMAALTAPDCGTSCARWPSKNRYRCCSPEYCESVKDVALARGVEVPEPVPNPPTLPGYPDGANQLIYMGPAGCVVPPYLRPDCALHHCRINSVGTSGNAEFDERYFALRQEIEELELRQAPELSEL